MIKAVDMMPYIRSSNLIENIDNPREDRRSAKAWNWLMDQPLISLPVLLELHHRITAKQLPKGERGEFRKVNVQVGGRLCPAPELSKQITINWLYDMLEHAKTLEPKEMHIRFEKAHPFVDGNGRTGRMLMWWHEVQLGRTPTFVGWENRRDYYQWFKEDQS